jgi:hypothetical protein
MKKPQYLRRFSNGGLSRNKGAVLCKPGCFSGSLFARVPAEKIAVWEVREG